jgi:hypothetical protein
LFKLQKRTLNQARSRSSIALELRRKREGVITLRASNDTIVDHYGTVITVEALHDWWEGFQQHRTVNLQHNLKLRGIEGRPMVGVVTRIDFTPQLEVEVRVFDEATNRLIDDRTITAGSLEFVATQEERRTIGDQEARVYYRLASEPELTGLALVDIPGVPGTDILEVRSLLPSWAYAVVDPRVLSGEVTDPAIIEQLRWLPHHDPETRMTSTELLERAYAELQTITVPAEASLSREQIISRAMAHLDRHKRLGLGMRASQEEEIVNKWIQLRVQQYQAEGLSAEEAKAKAKADYQALSPEVRARIEGGEGNQGEQNRQEPPQPPEQRVTPQRDESQQRFTPVVVNVNGGQQVEQRAAEGERQTPQGEQGQQSQQNNQIEQQVNAIVDARVQALMRQPENPMAAIASGLQVRSQRMSSDEILSEVLSATVIPQLQRRALDSQALERVNNILQAHGISQRALSIEANATVIYEELARQFVVRPAPDIVFRNHMRSVPMAGTRKADFPRFSRAGLTFEWNRSGLTGVGTKDSTDPITESQPTLNTFPIEVTELNGAVPVTDGFLQFNASGTVFVQQYLLPELRAAAQYEEDRAMFLSTGVHPEPATFKGLRNADNATVVASAANGNAFDEPILNSLLRAMPVAFRNNVQQLAFYLPVSIADDLLEIRSARQTMLGDRTLERDSNIPGPQAVAFYRGIPVFAVPQLPTNETQGTATGIASTIYLVHREQPVIGDALTIRIEPYRKPGFQTLIQLQEFVGLGYQWPEAIVRRVGILPAVFS